jgi:hypothetical protein
MVEVIGGGVAGGLLVELKEGVHNKWQARSKLHYGVLAAEIFSDAKYRETLIT